MVNPSSFQYQIFESPVGPLYLVSDSRALYGVIFARHWSQFKKKFSQLEEKENLLLRKTRKQLAEYFAGRRRTFDIPLHLEGTLFQREVWLGLNSIPFGETRSYKEQALQIQRPKAVRAIGRTNGLNPISIVLPCHRVIGSDGSLTGYGGGLKVKKVLLDFERAHAMRGL